MVNVMLEVGARRERLRQPDGTTRFTAVVTVSPGIRGGWNLKGDKQIVIGAAIPITWVEGTTSAGVFAYFSYELPFKK